MIASRLALILDVVFILCLTSCRSNDVNRMVLEPVQECHVAQSVDSKDTVVVVSETPDLILYKPLFYGGVSLECEYDCHPAVGDNRIFVAAGAYTKSYDWSEFHHGLIAGKHVDGDFYDGYAEPANSGAFYYVNSARRWGFAYHGYEQILRDISKSEGSGVAFSQVMLVYNGSACSIHPRANPYKLRHRRAICDIDNELYIVDSKKKMSMFDFAECLKDIGVFHALYMDMGSMKYSAYKKFYGDKWIEIHPRTPLTKYCSNYLVFYHVN